MRHYIRKFALLTAALMIMAIPVLAEEGALNPTMEPAQQAGKDECLLVAVNCSGGPVTIQNRIDRIQNEINRGTSVYTNDELKTLQDKLDGAKRELDIIEGGA